jgi:hypothetical protein
MLTLKFAQKGRARGSTKEVIPHNLAIMPDSFSTKIRLQFCFKTAQVSGIVSRELYEHRLSCIKSLLSSVDRHEGSESAVPARLAEQVDIGGDLGVHV